MPTEFRGIYTAMVTPMTPNEEVDFATLETFVNYLIDQGVHGLIPLGSTGEYYALSPQEREAVIRATLDAAVGLVADLHGVELAPHDVGHAPLLAPDLEIGVLGHLVGHHVDGPLGHHLLGQIHDIAPEGVAVGLEVGLQLGFTIHGFLAHGLVEYNVKVAGVYLNPEEEASMSGARRGLPQDPSRGCPRPTRQAHRREPTTGPTIGPHAKAIGIDGSSGKCLDGDV